MAWNSNPICCTLLSVIVNAIAVKALHDFERIIIFIHVLGFFSILIPPRPFAPKGLGLFRIYRMVGHLHRNTIQRRGDHHDIPHHRLDNPRQVRLPDFRFTRAVSFVRDRGLPFSSVVAQVNPSTHSNTIESTLRVIGLTATSDCPSSPSSTSAPPP